jgi:hypothetical protein
MTEIITRTKAGAKLETLTRAGLESRPACEGDYMFIAEKGTLSTADYSRMRKLCRTCPLFALCSDYARTAKPDAGFWAGTPYGKPERPVGEDHVTTTPREPAEERRPPAFDAIGSNPAAGTTARTSDIGRGR